MPFPIVWGIPQDTPLGVLAGLRVEIVTELAQMMGVPAERVRPFFPSDLLDDPVGDAEGGSTIYVSLVTGMFGDKPDEDDKVVEILTNLAEVVWRTFEGKLDVEAFVEGLNPNWKALVKADPLYQFSAGNFEQ